MRYITVPKKQKLVGIVVEKETGKPVEYGLEELNRERVWGSPKWREKVGPEGLKAMRRVFEAFEGKKPGDVVELENEDYELYEPIVSARGEQIQGVLAPYFAVLMLSVQTAERKKAGEEEEPAESAPPNSHPKIPSRASRRLAAQAQ